MVYFVTICIGFTLGCMFMFLHYTPKKDGNLYVVINEHDQEAIGGIEFLKNAKDIMNSKYVLLEVQTRNINND